MAPTLPPSRQASYSLKDGDSFLVCDARGDIHGGAEADGLFHDGTRALSRLRLSLVRTAPTLLSAAIAQDRVGFSAHLAHRRLPPIGGSAAEHGVVHVSRSRFLWQGRLHERITCTNCARVRVSVPVVLELAAGFRDMFEVRGMERARRGSYPQAEARGDRVVLHYDGLDGVSRRTVLA